MNQFEEAKIYTITNKLNKKVYVGSTYQALSTRFSGHKAQAKQNKCNMKLYEAMRSEGINNFDFALHHKYPCSSREEVNREERRTAEKLNAYIDGYNVRKAGRTTKEWQQDNKEYMKHYQKRFRENNKDYFRTYYAKNKQYWSNYHIKNRDNISKRKRLTSLQKLNVDELLKELERRNIQIDVNVEHLDQ